MAIPGIARQSDISFVKLHDWLSVCIKAGHLRNNSREGKFVECFIWNCWAEVLEECNNHRYTAALLIAGPAEAAAESRQ
ncbi:hypothetical protein T4B_14186 [Trichinella pseudospiralis]|uniref:Uncharacterized protein n=1 Tax=Trichinella pseudospiralis TaxID=6337 RepID=A0A0V1J819_TRIPS|nr:hypothetical protein T4B_14186 [Trichinella pseudospiralis]KRZ43276.1 hypothetical protein T4C_8935 [Trichinella pseudospiralis]